MKKFIILGVGVFIISLIIHIPVSILAQFLPANISAQQLDGNIWRGSAAALSVNSVALGLVAWQIKPACLLVFKFCAQVEQRNGNISVSALLKVRNTVELHELKARGDTAILKPLLNQYALAPSGSFSVDMLKIVLHDGQLKTMQGKLRLSSLALNGVLRVFIGDTDAVFKPRDNHTQITVRNQKGHLDVSAKVALKADLSYRLEMNIRKNALSSDAVINGMQYVGKPLADGSRQLQQSGRLTI